MEKGYLFVCSKDDAEHYLATNHFDIKLHIVRSRKKGVPDGFLHVPELAPSEKLFNKTLNRWKKNKFTSDDLFYLKSINSSDWFNLYRRDYLLQIQKDKNMNRYLKRVQQRLDEGKNIIMTCYCLNPDRCHRTLLAKHFESLGYKVFYH